MSNDNASLGKASLWTSIAGIVLPGCLAVLVVIFVKSNDQQRPPLLICGVLFTILELVALGCGIAARRTPTGKAGLVISGIIFLLQIAVGLFELMRSDPGMPRDQQAPPEARPELR